MSEIEISRPSFMSLFIKMKFNEQTISTATGFVVNSKAGPLLITNRHNFTGRHQVSGELLSDTGAIPNEVEIYHHELNNPGVWLPVIEPIISNDTSPLWFEHPVLGKVADLVALKLTHSQEIQIYPYDIYDFESLSRSVADTISVIGFPFGRTGGGYLGVWATGFIASEPDLKYNNLPQFLIDCRSRPGQSGSPVIKYHNGGIANLQTGGSKMLGPCYRLCGIYSGRINNQSDIGVVWNLNAIRELTESVV